jgi:hypothetical protein
MNFYPNPIQDILIALCDEGLDYIVCGGIAVVLHGVERLTMDIDISIDFESGNVRRLITAMETLGLNPRVPVAVEGLCDETTRKRWMHEKGAVVFSFIDPDRPYRQLDVFLESPIPYASLRKSAVSIELDGRTVMIASIDDLVAMKSAIKAPRQKDEEDIAALIRIQERGQ